MSEKAALEESKRLLAEVANAEELKNLHRRARIAVTYRLGIHKVVLEECEFRKWPTDDEFVTVLSLAVSFWMQGALKQRLKRPKSADAIGDRWPAANFYASAKAIVDTLLLGEIPNRVAGIREQDRA